MSKKKKDKAKKGRSKDPSSRLKALQKSWKKSSPKRFGQQAPDGSYEIKIVSAVIEEAKAESKRLQVKWGLEVLEGDYKGRELVHRSGLEGEQALDYFQGELDVMELEIPESITDIPELLPETIGLELLVSLSTRNEFQNLRFEELLEADEEDEDLEEDDDDDDDDDDEEEEEEEEDEDEDEDEEEEDEEEDDDKYPTTKEIKKMKKKALLELIDEYELEVDPEGLTAKELVAAVIEASVEDEEADEDEDEDEDE